MKEFNLLTSGYRYDYILSDKRPFIILKNLNQSLYLVAFFETDPDYKDRFGQIIIYNTFTKNTFLKYVLKDKADRLYIKIKVEYLEKVVYLDEFKKIL